MSGQQHAPTALYLRGKTRYTFYRSLGGPQGRSGRARNLVLTGIQSRTYDLNIIPNLTTRAKFGLLKKKQLPFMLIVGEDVYRVRYWGRIVQKTALNWLS